MNFHLPANCKHYLMFISYIGNAFRGMQKQRPILVNNELKVLDTVQQSLEDAIAKVLRVNHYVYVKSSSRTDAGVHALRSSAHVRIASKYEKPPDEITYQLNKHFSSTATAIRILSTHIVPHHFSVRQEAISRTYLYRFAVRKNGSMESKHMCNIPFSEYGRTFFIFHKLNIERMKEAAAMLVGTKNFFCFMSKPSLKNPQLSTVRTLMSLTVQPAKAFMPEHEPQTADFEYWEVKFHGASFLYKQIRRTMGVLFAVGSGVMNLDDVRLLLDKPVAESWNQRALCVPAYGLYLLDVEYPSLDYVCRSLEDIDVPSIGSSYAL